FVGGLCALNQDLAQAGWQNPRVFEKGDEADGLGAECLVLVLGEYAMAVGLWFAGKLGALLGAFSQPMQPAQCVVDVFVLEAHRGKLMGQDIRFRTGLRCIVGFEQINQYIEHRDTISGCRFMKVSRYEVNRKLWVTVR